MDRLSGLFAPRLVAVVGATDRAGSIGRAVMENLVGAFEGTVVPVNPNRDSVLGRPCVPDVGAAGDVDLAVVVVPAEAVLGVVRDAAAAGVRSVVVISAGFGESGPEGEAREAALAALAAEHDLDLVGPNSLGVIATGVGLNATFAPTDARPGGLSFLSQSGAVVTSVLDWANDRGIGFADVVSLGNKAVLDEVDFVEAWDEDPDTDVVLGYLESVTDGRAFLDRVSAVTRSTPVVLLKAGRTAAGSRAAASHTGAIAGSDRAYDAAFEQAGVLRATSLSDLFDVARALADQPVPEGDGVAVVSNAGGLAVLAADALEATPLSLATFDASTVEALEAALPDEADAENPLDVLGDADVGRFRDALDAVVDDPNVDAVAVLSAPTAIFGYEALAGVLTARQGGSGAPMVACLMGGEGVRRAESVLREAGVPNYADPARAVRGLGALAEYREIRDRAPAEPERFPVDRERADAVLARAAERGVEGLGVESRALLTAYGVPTAAGELVADAADAADAAARLGGPVVLKVASPDVLHKTDVGGVAVGVPADAAAERYEAVVDRVRSARPDAAIEGVLVQSQVDATDAVETLVGVTRDAQFGPLVAFGLGGIFVEVFDDVAIRVAPVGAADARAMTRELSAAPMLRGARGRPPVDLDAVAETIQRVSQLAVETPAVLELDVNPLLATPDGVVAVDFRATLDGEQPSLERGADGE